MRAWILAGLLSSACGPALAQSIDDFDRVAAFGDSLIDAGAYGARFTTNPGEVATQVLADRYGSSTLPALPLGGPANADAWIYGAGGVGVTSQRVGLGPYVTQQVDAFLATSAPGPNDLIVLQGGPNDVFTIAGSITPGTEAAAQAAISAEANALAAQLDRLEGAGLIVVLNMPDIAATPLGVVVGPSGQANFDLLVAAYNTTLYNAVGARSGDILVLDTYGFINAVTAEPARFGFANVASPACTVSSAFNCTPATLVAAGADQNYFFADLIHPTAAGHLAFADYAFSVLNAPNQAAAFGRALMLQSDGERAVSTSALEATLAGQSGGIFGGLTGDSFEDGDAFGALFGVSARAGEQGAFGAALTYKSGDASASGLEHDFDSIRLTAFGGLNLTDRFTISGRLSAAQMNLDDIARSFAIYQGRINESGDTEALGYSAALQASYQVVAANGVRHGPFAEIAYDALDVDAYSERGASPFALEFGEQELRRTLVLIGYQVHFGGPGFSPYARAAWVETLDSDAGEISVSLVNTPGTWTADAPDLDDDGYVRLDAGFSAPAFWGARLMVVGSANFADDNETASVFVGLSRGF